MAEACVAMLIPLPLALTVMFPDCTSALEVAFEPALPDGEVADPPLLSDAPPEGPPALAEASPGSPRALAPRLSMAMTYEFPRRITISRSVSLLLHLVPTG
jgi:hypothetical protein